MIGKFKILFIALSFSFVQSLSAQTLKGELYNPGDSLPAMFVNIVQVDSSGKILSGTTTNDKGKFILQISKKTEFIKIYQSPEFAEIHITNLKHAFRDTLDLEKLQMIKAPSHLQVQFKDISEKKEKRKQRQIIKAYNKKVKGYEDRYLEINNQTIQLTVNNYKPKYTNRLRLIYILNLNELNKKTKANN